MEKKQLLFGIICNSMYLENWQLNSIQKMLELEFVELGLIIIIKNKRNNLSTVGNKIRSFFNQNHSRLLRLTKDVPILEWEPVKTNVSENNFPYDTKKVITYNLDFLLNFSANKINGEIINLPYGVWELQHRTKWTPYFWDIFYEESVTFASLCMLSSQFNHQVILKKGCFSIINDSFKKNRSHITSAMTDWPALVCKNILNSNAINFEVSPVDNNMQNIRKPTLKQIGKFIIKLLIRKFEQVFLKLFCYEYWNVGVVEKPIYEFLVDTEPNIHWLVQKKDVYFADPFAYQDENGLHILMEELDYRVVKGYISRMNIKKDCKWDIDSFEQAIMRLPSHMSYPYLLEYNNELYCIPETSEAMETVIYKLNKLTGNFEKVKTILENFHAVDSTIIHYGEYWWLFCTKSHSSYDSHNHELHIFYAADLLDDWKPHMLNPVKIDIRSSRPAGTPFIYKGELYRPAQDCSKTYGGRIVMNKIKSLSKTQFYEEPVCYIQPKRNSLFPDGVHTISSLGDITIFDGKRFDYRLSNLFKKLYKYKTEKLSKIKAFHNKMKNTNINRKSL